MVKTVYVDLLFFVNFSVDFLLLYAAAVFSGLPYRRGRLLLGAALGGLYAVVAYFPAAGLLTTLPLKFSSGLCVAAVAYGVKPAKSFRAKAAAFMLMSLLFAGAVLLLSSTLLSGYSYRNGAYYADTPLITLFAACVASMAIIRFFFGGKGLRASSKRTVDVCLMSAGKETKFTALVDTGNILRDPVSGSGIVITELEALCGVLSADCILYLARGGLDDPMGAMAFLRDPKFRLVPYRTVGARSGLLLAFRPEKILIDGRERKDALIAISPTEITKGSGCRALVGLF